MKATAHVRVISCEDDKSQKTGNGYTRLWLHNEGGPLCVFPPKDFYGSELHRRLQNRETFEAEVVLDLGMEGKWNQTASCEKLEEVKASSNGSTGKVRAVASAG